MREVNRIWILMGKQLSGSIVPVELQELEDLLVSDPELWYSYELLQAVISLDDVPEEFIMELKSLLDKQAEPDKLNSLILCKLNDGIDNPGNSFIEVLSNSSSKYKKYLSYAVAFAIATSFIWFGSIFLTQPTAQNKGSFSAMNEIISPKGSKTQITLADGTSIWLNAGSKLVYPKNFSLENREVYLTGEAYFTVIHNDKYSFIVHIPEADIIDLGTTFNVKAYSNNTTAETTLIKGSLEVVLKNNSSQRIMMRPNEKLVLHKRGKHPNKHDNELKNDVPDKIFEVSSIVPFQATNDTVETSWINNKLIFRDERFEDLVMEMERRYNVIITIQNEEVKNYQVTGIFGNENIEQALKYLQAVVAFKFKIKYDQVFIDK